MDKPFGANVGLELEAAVMEAPKPVSKPQTGVDALVFCALSMDGVNEGSLGCRFPDRVKTANTLKGWLLTGPTSKPGLDIGYKEFTHSLKAYRWCLNQGKLYQQHGKQVWQRGSITEDIVMAVACRKPRCEWRDTWTRYDVFMKKELKQGCPTCGSPIMSAEQNTTVFPGGSKTSAVCQTPNDDMLQAMHVSMHEQAQQDSFMLPRIYAVYQKDESPFDWVPKDAKAAALASRFQAIDQVIRPCKQARMAYDQAVEHKRRTHIMDFVIEAHNGVRFGWVPVKDLAPKVESGDLGFTRRFGWTPSIKFM